MLGEAGPNVVVIVRVYPSNYGVVVVVSVLAKMMIYTLLYLFTMMIVRPAIIGLLDGLYT